VVQSNITLAFSVLLHLLQYRSYKTKYKKIRPEFRLETKYLSRYILIFCITLDFSSKLLSLLACL